jgi:hypothetical protein
MSKPWYVAWLRGQTINGSRYSCEGEQIAAIIACIAPVLPECVWFVADIEQVDGPRRFPEDVTTPAPIGNTEETIDWLRQVPQFVWGSFLAVPTHHLPVSWPAVRSEDIPFHDIGAALIEVIAFDSSEMHAYAAIQDYLEPLADRFGAAIQTAADEPWAAMLVPFTPEWRRRAIADFPGLSMLRIDLDYSPYWLLSSDLLPMVRSAREHPDAALLQRIFDYAEWCLGQRVDELSNAAGVSFYEHLFDEQEDWETVLPYLSSGVIKECWPLWEQRWDLWESRTSRQEIRWLRETLAQQR